MLGLTENHLVELPSELNQCLGLTTLSLTDNNLVSIPDLQACTALEQVDLARNPLAMTRDAILLLLPQNDFDGGSLVLDEDDNAPAVPIEHEEEENENFVGAPQENDLVEDLLAHAYIEDDLA